MADYDEAWALWKRTEGIGLSQADEPRNIASFLARNPGLSFVAEEEGKIVGAVLCGSDGRRGFLHHLAVEKSRHGRASGGASWSAAFPPSRRSGFASAISSSSRTTSRGSVSGGRSGGRRERP